MSIERPHRFEFTSTGPEHRAVTLASIIAGMRPATFVREATLHAAAALVEGIHHKNAPESNTAAPRPASSIETFMIDAAGRARLEEMGRKGQAGDAKAAQWTAAVLARCHAERVILEDAARRLAELDGNMSKRGRESMNASLIRKVVVQ